MIRGGIAAVLLWLPLTSALGLADDKATDTVVAEFVSNQRCDASARIEEYNGSADAI